MTPLLSQIRTLAIIPACQALGLDSPAARNLLLGTCAHESEGGLYLAQYPEGPALVYWQMEPATALDTINRTNAYGGQPFSWELRKLAVPQQDRTTQVSTNLVYAAALCRLKYWLDPEPLPAADDLPGQAAYWKRVYNTADGAGTTAEYLADFTRLVGALPD